MSLGTGAFQVGRGPAHLKHNKEVSMATLRAGATPAWNCHLAPSHWKEFSGNNTYRALHLPKPMNQEGGRAGSKNPQRFTEK